MAFLEGLDSANLSDVEITIQNYILENIDKIPYMRVRDIANNAHVSPTSVFRFVQRAQFSSFTEFRYYVKEYLEKQNTHSSGHALGIEEHLSRISKDMFLPNTDDYIEELADKISQSDLTIFIGLGSSGSIGEYISRRLANLGIRCLSFQNTYLLTNLMRAEEKTVVVFLSISGETLELVDLIEKLPAYSTITTACITQHFNSKIARKSDIVISYKATEERRQVYFDLSSQLPVVVILETLFDYLYENPS